MKRSLTEIKTKQNAAAAYEAAAAFVFVLPPQGGGVQLVFGKACGLGYLPGGVF